MATGHLRSASVNNIKLEDAPGFRSMETFAVAVLDDGTEIRMRNFGDRVEIRTWDKEEKCHPADLLVLPVNKHIVDVRPKKTGE